MKFNPYATCPKCDYDQWVVTWHVARPPQRASWAGCPWHGEHMHHVCDRCRYEWRSDPLLFAGEAAT
jgi:hypothetical protein